MLALKGGTAINFFIQDMPRLSVDIDLTYLPLDSRQLALQNISAALGRIAALIRKAKGIKVHETKIGDRILKLVATDREQQVVIEPNEVLRGAVYKIIERSLSPEAEKTFELSLLHMIKNLEIFGKMKFAVI